MQLKQNKQHNNTYLMARCFIYGELKPVANGNYNYYDIKHVSPVRLMSVYKINFNYLIIVFHET